MPSPGCLSPDSRRLPLSLSLAVVSIAISLNGCQTAHVVEADASGAPKFDRLRLVYELNEPVVPNRQRASVGDDDSIVALSYAKAHPIQAALASRQAIEPASPAFALRLIIEAPHPQGTPDQALVTLVAYQRETGTRQTLAHRTIARSEVDLLFVHLARGGVCDEQTRLQTDARIAIEVDGHRVVKRWTREPRLDRLAAETYDAGKTSLTRPASRVDDDSAS